MTAIFLAATHALAQPADVLKPLATIPLHQVEGRIDHMAVDGGGRLYMAALGNNTVEVIDTQAGRQVGRITGLRKPQGVAFIPDSGRIAVTSGDDGRLLLYGGDQKLLGTVDGLDDADNVRYDARGMLLYVGYGEGALAIIDPAKPGRVGEIKLPGHPESFQLESQGPRIFVNVPSARQVAVIDREKRAVIATWKITEARASFAMALDEVNHRLFVACREPAKLLVLDAQTGQHIAALDCVGDADDLFYDGLGRRLYISGGQGDVDVIAQSDPDHYQPLARIATAPGARTSLLDLPQHRLYVAVPHRAGVGAGAGGGQPAELRLFEVGPTPSR